MSVKDFEIIWFDSLGAKSSSITVRGCNLTVVVDPGIAIMHRSFPASRSEKIRWFEEGLRRVKSAIKAADIIIITHYHHDHYLYKEEHMELYRGKKIIAKNPNIFINRSQRARAENFYQLLYKLTLGIDLDLSRTLKNSVDRSSVRSSVLKALELALSKDYGDYNKRRKELIDRGLKELDELSSLWSEWPTIPEISAKGTEVYFADRKAFDFDCIKLEFTEPLFHGVEFSRLGWVVGLNIRTPKITIYYSSDVNGPIIEDYAYQIVKANPEILVLDGPPTYLLGYTLNRINLKRAVENAIYIIENSQRLEIVIYDHHLVREPRFRERTREVWKRASKLGVKLVTASELLGKQPVVLKSSKDRKSS